jgi:ketosteroid isomerase-like protein
MKHCPACRSQYTDPTLRFCLQDGAMLGEGETKQSTIDTISFSDPVTAENLLRTEDLKLFAPPVDQTKTQKWNPEPPKSARRQAPQIKQTKSSAKLLLTVFGALVVLAAAGGGFWFYLKNQSNSSARLTNSATPAAPAQETEPASNSSSKAVLDNLSATNSNAGTTSNPGAEDAKKEISQTIELWKQAIEARKLPDYLSRYAEKVDYFEKTAANSADIRSEAQKMFDAYSEIEITLSNVRVAVDSGGTQATAVFDKEWSYETEKDLLEGKAHTKLRFQKNDGQWKITSEKYQKIYYMEN